MTAPTRNYNDPRSHVHLARLLDRPEELSAENRARVLKRLSRSLELAMSLPEGPDRIDLLETLNTALGDALRMHQYYRQMNDLHAVLKATQPDAAEIHQQVGALQQGLKLIHAKAKEAQELDAANGTDVNRTAWFWFVHELHGVTDFMHNQLRKLGRLANATATPASDQDKKP